MIEPWVVASTLWTDEKGPLDATILSASMRRCAPRATRVAAHCLKELNVEAQSLRGIPVVLTSAQPMDASVHRNIREALAHVTGRVGPVTAVCAGERTVAMGLVEAHGWLSAHREVLMLVLEVPDDGCYAALGGALLLRRPSSHDTEIGPQLVGLAHTRSAPPSPTTSVLNGNPSRSFWSLIEALYTGAKVLTLHSPDPVTHRAWCLEVRVPAR